MNRFSVFIQTRLTRTIPEAVVAIGCAYLLRYVDPASAELLYDAANMLVLVGLFLPDGSYESPFHWQPTPRHVLAGAVTALTAALIHLIHHADICVAVACLAASPCLFAARCHTNHAGRDETPRLRHSRS